MPRLDLEKTAYIIECFLNVLRISDGPDRTGLESILVRWLASPAHHKSDCVIYIDAKVICRSRGQDISVFETPQACQSQALWCDGNRISIIDAKMFRDSAKLEMLGTEGLDLTMPGN